VTPRTTERTAQIREQRRRALLEAARQLFAAKGFEKTKVSDVAARAGVSQGTVYWYFKSKDDLLMAVFEDWLRGISRDYREVVSEGGSVEDRLCRYAQAVARRMEAAQDLVPIETEFWALIFRSDAVRDRFYDLFRQLRSTVVELLGQGIATGELRDDINTEHIASIAIAVYDGLLLQWAAEPEAVDWQAVTDTFVDVMLNGGRKR